MKITNRCKDVSIYLQNSINNSSMYSYGNVILNFMLLGIRMQYKEPALESLQLTALRCCIDPLIITYSFTESHLLHQHTHTESLSNTHTQETHSGSALTT